MKNSPSPVPDHELLRVIGRGSYGEVWLARNVMGVLRAVKLVHRDRFDHERPYEREFAGIQRYEPLSRTSAGLVQVLHVGRDDQAGCFYYVMELADAVPGTGDTGAADVGDSTRIGIRSVVPETYAPRTLRSALDRLRRLPVDECVELACSLATGLAQLHRHGLVHRDLKPSNVIFVHGRAKLADVGLVAGADESRSFVGTEGFVPPEGPGTATADLYALSRVLYQAATGLDPERFPEIPADWLDAPDAPALIEFHEVLLKLGEGRAASRYQNAGDLLADLTLIQSGKSVRQLRTLERRVVWFRRLGLTAGAGLLIAGLAWLWAQREATRERDNFNRVAAAEQRARRELIGALLARARAERLAGGLDRRDAGLRALTNAALLQPDRAQLLALRSEAAATLAQRGLRWVPAPTSLGHPDPMSVACDASQELTASWDLDGAVVVRRLVDGQEKTRLPALQPVVDEVLGFNDTRQFLVVRRGDERMIGDLQRKVYCRTNRLATFTSDNRLWLVAPGESLVCEQLPDGRQVQRIPLSAGFEKCAPWRRLAVAEGGHLAAAGADGRIVWWHPNDPTPAGIIQTPGEIYSLAWNHSGEWLAAGTADGEVLVWHLPDPLVRWTVRAHTAAVRQLAFSHDDQMLAAGSESEVLKLLEVRSGRLAASLPAVAWQLSFRPTDNRLALVWRGGEAGFIELLPSVGLEPRHGSRDAAADGALAFSPDGRWLAAGTIATVDVWDQSHGTLAGSFLARGLRAVAFSQHPAQLHWLDDDGAASVDFLSTAAFTNGEPKRDRSRGWTHLSLSTQGTTVLADGPGEALVVRTPDGKETSLGPHPFARFTATRFDGSLIASGSLTQPGVRLWDVANAQPIRRLASGLNVRPVFSPDGQWLATAGPTCSLWHGPAWEAGPALPSGPANTVAGAAAFSPDGKLLAVVYGDHEVRLFDLPAAEPRLTLEAPGGNRVLAVAFSPDGHQLALVTTEGELLLWNLPQLTETLIALGLPE